MKNSNKRSSKFGREAGFKARLHIRKNWYDRAAHWMTSVFGTVGFLVFNVVFFAIWILVNINFFPSIPAFDPFPFNFLTMFVSLEAIVLSVVVLISQNKESRIADLREELDFEINLRAEKEITRIIKMLRGIHDHLGMRPEHDSELKEMQEYINIKKLEADIENQKD